MSDRRKKEYFYPYGKFYDINREDFFDKGNYDLIIYSTVKNQGGVIGSLEGIFVSPKDLSGSTWNSYICRRDQMKEFEKKHKGKFFEFEK